LESSPAIARKKSASSQKPVSKSAQLREERAAAEEVERLRNRQGQMRSQISRMREGGGSLPADPVAELFAWLSRGQLSVRDIAFGSHWSLHS